MTEIDQFPWRRLFTSVGVSSLSATFLNVGVSVLDHPRALGEPTALLLPAAAGIVFFVALQVPLLVVARLLDRRWAWHASSYAAATGSLACVAGALAPVVTALAREASGDRGVALWGMLATSALASGLAAFVISERGRSRGLGSVASAMPLVAVEVCFGLWFFEYHMEGESTALRMGYFAGLLLVCLATFLAVRRLTPGGANLIAGALFALVAGSAILSLEGPADVVTASKQGPGAAPKTVVLITVDTLRPDMIGGADGAAETPAISSLMDDSVVFENARSPAPWTKPAMASILTGLNPAVHRVTNRRTRLSDRVDTLAEHMKSLEYHTMGLGLNAHLEPLYNFRQGFDRYRFPAREDWGWSVGSQLLAWMDPDRYPPLFPTTEAIADVAIEWMRAGADKPFFLWMHVLDPHWPYEPPEAWVDEDPHSRFGLSWGAHETVTNVQAGNTKLGVQDREFVRQLYRGEVRYADANVGRVLDELKAMGRYDEALIVFASDHGEEFWEHGTFEHGHTLYDEVLRVPLAFKLPYGDKAQNLETAVSTESIAPTVLDVLGARYDPDDFSGQSLRPLWNGEEESGPVFSTGTYYFDEKMAVVHEGWKLIRKLELDQYELYRLTDDPEELDSRYYRESDEKVRDRLKLLLADWVRRMVDLRARLGIQEETVAVSAEVDASLRGIGYLGD